MIYHVRHPALPSGGGLAGLGVLPPLPPLPRAADEIPRTRGVVVVVMGVPWDRMY